MSSGSLPPNPPKPFQLFITNRSKLKELELTQKPLKWNIEGVNLDIRACNIMLMWAVDYNSHSIMNDI